MFIHRPKNKQRLKAAFSLLEVLVAMALIMMVIGGVFAIADGALSLGAAMNAASLREMRVAAFEDQLRTFLANVNAKTRFETAGSGEEKTLLIKHGGAPFAWQRSSQLADMVAFTLDAEDRKNAVLLVQHFKLPKSELKTSDEPKRLSSVDLLDGIRLWNWELYHEKEKVWKTSWSFKDPAPLFVRLTFGLNSDSRDFTYTFWVSKDGIAGGAEGTPPAPNPAVPPS